MRVAFFGGSFDPPHRGHLVIARAAAENFALDRVLFAPAGNQPLKPGGAYASFSDRLAMVKLLCQGATSRGIDSFEPSSVDAPRADGLPNYTVTTLLHLRAGLHEADELFSIVGADSFLGLRSWRESDELLDLAEWIVVSRPGFSLEGLAALKLTAAQRGHVHLLEGVDVPVSATELRSRLAAGDDCSASLTPPVMDYVRTHGLYGCPR